MGAGAGLQNDSSVLHLLISLSRKQSSGSNVSNSNGCKDEASVACWPLTSYCVARSRLGKRKVKVLVAQSCPTLGNPMDCSLPGCSVHGILQARILEWIAMPSSRRSSQLMDLNLGPRFFMSEPPLGNPCSISLSLPYTLIT